MRTLCSLYSAGVTRDLRPAVALLKEQHCAALPGPAGPCVPSWSPRANYQQALKEGRLSLSTSLPPPPVLSIYRLLQADQPGMGPIGSFGALQLERAGSGAWAGLRSNWALSSHARTHTCTHAALGCSPAFELTKARLVCKGSIAGLGERLGM